MRKLTILSLAFLCKNLQKMRKINAVKAKYLYQKCVKASRPKYISTYLPRKRCRKFCHLQHSRKFQTHCRIARKRKNDNSVKITKAVLGPLKSGQSLASGTRPNMVRSSSENRLTKCRSVVRKLHLSSELAPRKLRAV